MAKNKENQYDEILHTVLDASPVPTVISRVDTGEILYANNAVGHLLRYENQNVVGRNAKEFYQDPHQRDLMIQILKKSGRITDYEANIKRGDGTVASVIYSGGIMDLGGEKVLISGIYDISGRKGAEEALRMSEERFRGFVEKAKDIVYSMDAQGVFTYISPRATELLGWPPQEFLGKPFGSLFHPEDAELTKKWFESGFQDIGWRTRDGIRLRHKNGEWRWFTSDASVIRNEDGTPIEIIGIAHDITEMSNLVIDLKKANNELKETQAQLAQSEKMESLGLLVAGLAHEINTPVGAISSMHDSLTRGIKKLKEEVECACFKDEDKKRFEALFKIIEEANRVINSGAERVGSIVKRLRSFARLDEAELKTADIQEGLEDTLSLVRHELKHDIEVIKNYGKVPPIPCFPGQLNQVFLNLLVNARQAIKGKGKISIATHAAKDKIYIDISDTGSGIAMEHLSKVFDPGFTTKGVGVGTGLGLSICYQIIRGHRGDITVKSELDKGTTFTIILPTNLDKLIGKT